MVGTTKAKESTLDAIKRELDAQAEMQHQADAAGERVKALAADTRANIDGLVTELRSDGRIAVGFQGEPCELVFSERQFLGMMGWGRKHVGEGPNGKKE